MDKTKLKKNVIRFIKSFDDQQLERLRKILCLDVNGDPCGMDFRSSDPDCYDCLGTGFVVPRDDKGKPVLPKPKPAPCNCGCCPLCCDDEDLWK